VDTQLIALLQNQHGTTNQLERFWFELYARKRKPKETLQDLYQHIRRLILLAFPNDVSETSERLAINQFTNALNNEDMRFEVLDKNPATLETALHIGMRYEALKPDHSAPQSLTEGRTINKEIRETAHSNLVNARRIPPVSHAAKKDIGKVLAHRTVSLVNH